MTRRSSPISGAPRTALGKPFYMQPRDPLPSREPIYDGFPWLTAATWAFMNRGGQGFQTFIPGLLVPLQDPIERQAAVVLAGNRDDMSQLRQPRTVQLAASACEFRDKLADHGDMVAGLESGSGDQRAASYGAQCVLLRQRQSASRSFARSTITRNRHVAIIWRLQ